jgi:hypothetical protein
MDRHERPFTCLEQSCNKRAFPDKGTLQRHQHSVHSNPNIRCPVKSCRRHTKGFARKDNLREHIKRAHPRELPQINGISQDYSYSAPVSAIGSKTIDVFTKNVQDGDAFIEETAKASWPESLEAQALEAKLEELKAERARRLKGLNLESLDEDIMAIERTLKLVKPTLT